MNYWIKPLLLKKIYAVDVFCMINLTATYSDQFINKLLIKKHGLKVIKTDKFILEAEDLMEVLWCYWITDINIFSNEQQRVQLVTLLLLTAFTGFQSEALFAVKYQDINLFIMQNVKIEKMKLMMQLWLIKMKSNWKHWRL